MSHESAPRFALFGNTQAVAWEDADGTIAWLALPTPDAPPVFDCLEASCGAGHFALEVVGPHTVERQYVGETPLLQTLVTTPDGGKASVLDFLPLRAVLGPNGLRPRVVHPRLIRIVECHAGSVKFRLRFAPRPDGVGRPEMEVDANGLLFVGDRTSVVLQSEAEVHLHEGGATGEFELKPKEKRHFVITAMPDTDPDIPEIRATEADWEVDGTVDFWVQWTLRCPFQGVQRTHVLRLASLLRAMFVTPARQRGRLRQGFYDSPYLMLAPVALAAWGWEEELAEALADWRPQPDDAVDRRQAAWLVWALASAQTAGLVEATLVTPQWAALKPMMDALAKHPTDDPVTVVAGLKAALVLADELMLEADTAAWESAVATAQGGLGADETAGFRGAALGLGGVTAEQAEPVEGLDRLWRVRQELTWGGYLQARRQMDSLLQAYGPLGTVEGTEPMHPDLGEWALALWTAAEIYLQEAPTPQRVHLEGDLGD